MYYYKTYYEDGTWDILKSKTPVRNPRVEVCATCYTCRIINIFQYYWLVFTGLFVR